MITGTCARLATGGPRAAAYLRDLLVRFSKHTVESVELGRRMPDVALVERSEEALGNTGALRKSSKYVTRGRGDVGLAAWFRQWARLERVAVSLCTYECRLVPGLLQSEGYARAVFDMRS